MLRKLLLGIDLFGISVPIKFSGKEKSTSKLGGTCSLIFFCFIGWTIYNSSDALFNKKNPNILEFDSYVEDPEGIDFSSVNFPMGIQIQAPDSLLYKPFINRSIYELKIVHNLLERIGHDNGTIEEKWTLTDIATEKCTPQHFGDFAPNFVNLDLDSIYCISQNQNKPEKIYIKGSYESSIYQSLSIFLLECDNTTSNIKCASKDILNTYLEGARFNLLYTDFAINLKNYSTPIIRFKNSYKTTISPLNSKSTTVELSNLEIISDAGWIMQSEETYSFTKVNKITEEIPVGISSRKVLITCNFEASRFGTHHSRSYKKIQNVLSEVGGLANALFVIFLIIITPYLKFKVRESLMNELFEISLIPKMRRKRSKSCIFKPPTVEDHISGDDVESDSDGKTEKSDPQKDESKLSQFVRQLSVSSAFLNRPKFRFRAGSEQRSNSIVNMITQMQPNNTNENSQKQNSTVHSIPNRDAFHFDYSSEFNDKQKTETVNLNLTQEKSASAGPNILDDPFTAHNFRNRDRKAFRHHTIEISKKFSKKDSSNLKNVIQGLTHSSKKSISKITIAPKHFSHEEKPNSEVLSDRLISRKITRLNNLKNLVNNNNRSTKTKLNLWEYICSFVYQPPLLKKKLELVNKGIQSIDQRLDVVNIFKKLRELDKLKVLSLDHEQLLLFNNMPKPEIYPNIETKFQRKMSFSRQTLKKLTFVQTPTRESQVFKTIENMKHRKSKTNIDKRLIEIFEELDF